MKNDQTVVQHLEELRGYLLWYVLSLILFAVIGYLIREKLIGLLLAPLQSPVFYASPTEGFDLSMQIAVIFSFLVNLPLLLYLSGSYLRPVFDQDISRMIWWLSGLSLILMIAGVGFAYLVTLPLTLSFLLKLGSEQIQPLLSASKYVAFIARYLLAFGIVFQTPVIILILNNWWQISVKKMWSYLRYVIVGAVILAAVITPTVDIINQLLVAGPLIILYLLTLLMLAAINIDRFYLKSIFTKT